MSEQTSRPKIVGLETEGKLDSKFGGVATYRVAANGDHIANDGTILSTAESRAKEDVPQWKKFELGRLEIVDNAVIPGPNALPKDIAQYAKNIKLTNVLKTRPGLLKELGLEEPEPVKIMPDDPNYTPLEKALNWAAETHHGESHQVRWKRVAAALGADNGYSPMSLDEVTDMWTRFGRNARWSMALDALDNVTPKEPAEKPYVLTMSSDLAEAIEAGDWATVTKIAQGKQR